MLPNSADTLSLPVVETFHSLQGEGTHAGRSAFFIRLAGCSVGCHWCDTKLSWPAAVHPMVSLDELALQACNAGMAGAAFLVITGGEPLEHNLTTLCTVLRETINTRTSLDLPLHLETSGVNQLSGAFDWITLSPKSHNPPTPQLLAACHELKVVVHTPEDLTFAEAMARAALDSRSSQGSTEPRLLLQPGDCCPKGLQLAIEYVKTHPLWRLSLQTHKLLGLR